LSLSVFDQQLLTCSISERHCSLPIAQDKLRLRRTDLLHLPIVIEGKDILVRLKPIDAVIAISRGKIDTISPRTKINAVVPAAAAQNTAPRVKRNHRVVPRSAHNRAHTRNSDAARRTGSIDNIDLLELRTRSINSDTVFPHNDCIRFLCGTNIVDIRFIFVGVVLIIESKPVFLHFSLSIFDQQLLASPVSERHSSLTIA